MWGQEPHFLTAVHLTVPMSKEHVTSSTPAPAPSPHKHLWSPGHVPGVQPGAGQTHPRKHMVCSLATKAAGKITSL